MSRKKFLVDLPAFSTGIRAAWREGYGVAELRKDIMAGLTIGTVAVPLSMALAIATGVPPQHGLYTAIVAGAIIALTGGARFNVSGPTAAFVVILFPIVQQHGLAGLLIATMMAGMILVILGLTRTGRLIQFVPYPVVLGFTAGIAVVIAVLQVPDFLGLETGQLGAHFSENVIVIFTSLPSLNWFEFSVGAFTLVVMLVWPRLNIPIPAPLVGLIVGAFAAYAINYLFAGAQTESVVSSIASRFSWQVNEITGSGIPPIPPTFLPPWLFPGPDGQPIDLSFGLIRELLGPAFAIAFLGAIESLLCAVVADGLTKTRHDPNAELIGQGLGNIVAPFFGGITATAAIARTATSIRSGARSPIAAVIHSLVVLLSVVALAGLLGFVPMAALASLLFIIAWNMSEARHFFTILRTAPAGDVTILVICFTLTVLFDMVLAVGVGVGLAAILFIRKMAILTQTDKLDRENYPTLKTLPKEVVVYRIDGPLFFGAAEKAITALHTVDPDIKTLIVEMHNVPSIDGTAIAALQSLINDMKHTNVGLIFVGLTPKLIVKLRRAGIRKTANTLSYCRNVEQAAKLAVAWQKT